MGTDAGALGRRHGRVGERHDLEFEEAAAAVPAPIPGADVPVSSRTRARPAPTARRCGWATRLPPSTTSSPAWSPATSTGNGGEDLLWYASPGTDWVWRWSEGRIFGARGQSNLEFR